MASETADPVLLGWPADGPTLRLDYRDFSYAGKFVMSNTGKAVIRDPEREPDDGSSDDGSSDDGSSDDGSSDDGSSDDGSPDGKWDDGILAAAAFNEDRTDPETLWLRYVTVRADWRGQGLGPRLCAFVVDRAASRGYERVRIAVNNPFAYEALYKSGFAFTGAETGVAELVLERPASRPAEQSTERYRDGLDRYRGRDLSAVETAFLERKQDATPPPGR